MRSFSAPPKKRPTLPGVRAATGRLDVVFLSGSEETTACARGGGHHREG